MKKFITWLVLLVFTTMIPAPVYAISRSSHSSSHRSSVSRPSPPASRPAPSPSRPSTPPPVKTPTPPTTPKPTAQASKPAPKKVAWTSNKKYGTAKATKAGKRPLKSRTPKPEPHSYNGRNYSSSDAIYTNTSGNWVMYFILGSLAGAAVANATNNNEVHCFDEQHKEIKCDRDNNSYQKDW